MKTPKDNLLRLYRKQGFDSVPVGFVLCESLEHEFKRRYPDSSSYQEYFDFPYRTIVDPGFAWNFENLDMIPGHKDVDWHQYYPEGLGDNVKFDGWGVAHESSPSSMHMTKMHHPLENCTTIDELESYPWPDFNQVDFSPVGQNINKIQFLHIMVRPQQNNKTTKHFL